MRRLLAAIFLALAWLLSVGCAHRYARTENRYLEDSKYIKWDNVEEKHDEQEQQRDVTKRDNTVTVRRKTTPSPQGPIVEEEFVLTLSELRDTSGVVTASSSRSAIAGEEQRKKKAENQLNVQADTKAGWWSPWWLLLLVPLAVGGWALRRWWRSFTPRLL